MSPANQQLVCKTDKQGRLLVHRHRRGLWVSGILGAIAVAISQLVAWDYDPTLLAAVICLLFFVLELIAVINSPRFTFDPKLEQVIKNGDALCQFGQIRAVRVSPGKKEDTFHLVLDGADEAKVMFAGLEEIEASQVAEAIKNKLKNQRD